MDVNKLKFFNRNGSPLNFQLVDGVWTGKMLYDNNGTDTYKVQSIYMMEETDPLSDADLGVQKFEYFPTGYNKCRKGNTNVYNVTGIKKVNNDVNFYTKWVYSVDIGLTLKKGDKIYFEGITTTNELKKYWTDKLNTFSILEVRKDSVLIETDSDNDTFSDLINLTDVTLHVIDCLELEITSESWNDTDFNSVLQINEPITITNSINNDNINYIKDLCDTKNIYSFYLNDNYNPSIGDEFVVTITLLTDRILYYEGDMNFNATYSTITFSGGLPNRITIGDEIIVQENTISVNSNNKQILTVTAIDKSSNNITVVGSGPLHNEYVNAFLYLASNKIIKKQQALKDPSGSFNSLITYNSLIKNLNLILEEYNLNSYFYDNTIYIEQTIPSINPYFTLTLDIINNNVISNLNVNSYSKEINIVNVKESLNNSNLTNNNNITTGYKELQINNVDTYGLDIILNGEVFHVDNYGTPSDTIDEWISLYGNDFEKRGIFANQYYAGGLIFEQMLPNVEMFIDAKLGQLGNYQFLNTVYAFQHIEKYFTVTIDNIDFTVSFNNDVDTTIQNWCDTFKTKLYDLGIIAEYVTYYLIFSTLSGLSDPVITIDPGYKLTPELLGYYFYIDLENNNKNNTCVSSNRIFSNNNINFENRKYYAGQIITVSGFYEIIANGAYNILAVDPDKIFLSYQGPIFNVPNSITINAGKGLRKPTKGLQSDLYARIKCSWEDTIKDEIFFFDFSGDQLYESYSGVKPLCGINNDIPVVLNKLPNTDITKSHIPSYQQTIFNELLFELPGADEPIDNTTYPELIQIHTGYKSTNEGIHNSTLHIFYEESLMAGINTNLNTNDDILVFDSSDNSINLQNSNLNFVNMGFKKGQYIKCYANDNTNDGNHVATLKNNGILYKIESVSSWKLIVSNNTVIDETTIKNLPVISPPYYTNGSMNMAYRSLSVAIIVQPILLLKVQLWGQTEAEDERYKLNLNRIGRNINSTDLNILKTFDNDENGNDTILLNNKRKQLLINGSEIFDYIGSYKSIKNAINYWEWTDLSLHEYFINVDKTSIDYGKLHTIDVIGLFDGTKPDHTKSKLPLRLPNTNYRKTNKFSLMYSLTDNNGNLISGLSVNEVYAKLYKLKNWLVEKVVPVGTQLRDISFKLKSLDEYTNVVSTLSTHEIIAKSEYSPIKFTVDGYKVPVNALSGNYTISITPNSIGTNFHYEIKVKTFGLEIWNSNKLYLIGNYVFNNGVVWESTINNININPSLTNNIGQWKKTTTWNMNVVQLYTEQKFDNMPITFTLNKNLDPNFEVTIISYNDYGLNWQETKNYTLDYGPWN